LLCPVQAADNTPSPEQISAEGRPPLILLPDDEVTLHSLQIKELADKVFKLDQNGEANFPMIGVVHLAGNTPREAEELLLTKLKKYYVDPDLEVSVAALHTEPVAVMGAVGAPGVQQMKGRVKLLEALSSAGGLRADAGPTVVVTRGAAYGKIPHPDAHTTPSGDSVVEIDVKTLLSGQDSTRNFVILPHDMITIPPAQIVYVVGNVKHAGGFPLAGKNEVSVLQALALAEGLDPRAAPSGAKILRRESIPEKEIPVDIKKILAGKAEDITMHPNDILFVPNSIMKAVTAQMITSALQIGTGFIIWH
jgi:polysaccharide export outer membrane protein